MRECHLKIYFQWHLIKLLIYWGSYWDLIRRREYLLNKRCNILMLLSFIILMRRLSVIIKLQFRWIKIRSISCKYIGRSCMWILRRGRRRWGGSCRVSMSIIRSIDDDDDDFDAMYSMMLVIAKWISCNSN